MSKHSGGIGTSTNFEVLTKKQKKDRKAYFAMLRERRKKTTKPVFKYVSEGKPDPFRKP